MIHGLKCKTLCGRNVHLFSLRMWKRSPCLLVASSLKKKFSPCRPTACCSPQAPPPRPPAWCAPRRSRIRLWWWSEFQIWNLEPVSCLVILYPRIYHPHPWDNGRWECDDKRVKNEMTILKSRSYELITSWSFPSLSQASLSKLERRLIVIFSKCW